MIRIISNICIYLSILYSSTLITAQVEANQNAQDVHVSKYAEGMNQAFELWGENKSIEALNMFERITMVETEEWLPKFYTAYLYIIESFDERDEQKLSAQLLKAQNHINIAKTLSKDNPELMRLQALLYTVWVAHDGQQYGMLYSAKISELYSKAIAIAPDNPNVVLAKAEWEMGASRFFGKSPKSYCEDIQKAIDLFATFKPKEPFYPTFGKERALQIQQATCK